MRASFTSAVVAAAILGSSLVQGQQYAGDVIPNSLPKLNNAEIAFWAMKSPTGRPLTLINYVSAPGNKRQDPSQVQRAVIVIHGLQRDPYNYWGSAYTGLQNAKKVNPAVNDNSVALIAPYFANGADKNVGFPWTDGLPSGQGSNTTALVWQASGWASGDDNQYPSKTTMSSFTAVDNIIKAFNNATLYPNLKHIVIAGHSLGGQFVQRYAMVGNQLGTSIPMTYWSGDPNSFGWLNSSRPINPAPSCEEYDDWRNGLSNYDTKYGAALVAKGPAAVEANFRTRRFVFARALLDFGLDDSSCAPTSQGANRGMRFWNFLNFFRPAAPQIVDYIPNVGHDAPTIYSLPAGFQRFYLDNWDGTGNYAPDQGPRMVPFDNPYPDPNYAAKWASYPGPFGSWDIPTPMPVWPKDSATINSQVQNPANNMQYAGCYTDSPARSLTKLMTSTNTSIESCVGQCANNGFTVAGVELGQECYCGNYLQNNATLVGERNCTSLTQGNATEYGGGPWLLSVYNSGSLTMYKGPQLVPSAGPYNSIGCWTDTGGSRTLSGKTPSGANTIEKCASACTGFSYFGMEFGVECYCGNTMNAVSKPAALSSCSMPCGGNITETCGAGNFLNMYQLNATAAGNTTTTTSGISTSTTSTISTTSTTSGAPTPSTTAGLKYEGCYTDAASRTLGFFAGANANTMAPNLCSSLCTTAGYSYAGIEFGAECYCGNSLTAGSVAPDAECGMNCAGDAGVKCGDSWRLSVYSVLAGSNTTTTTGVTTTTTGSSSTSTTSATTITTSTTTSIANGPTPSTISGLNYAGCYTDASSRTLGFFAGANDNTMAPNLCSSLCTAAGYTYAGIEYGLECYCGNSLSAGTLAPDSDCSMTCAGDKAVQCGASWRLSVYTVALGGSGTTTTATSTSGSTTSTSDSSVSTSTTSTTSSTTTTTTTSIVNGPTPSTISGLNYAGCYTDAASRTLGFFAGANDNTMAPNLCSSLCTAAGYTYAGIEYGLECYCGNSLSAGTLAPDSDCSMKCAGDKAVQCGASWRLSVYTVAAGGSASTTSGSSTSTTSGTSSTTTGITSTSSTSTTSSTTTTTTTSIANGPAPSTISGLDYAGCYTDASSRTLGFFAGANDNTMAPNLCSSLCTAAGYTYAGIEYGLECYCGNSLSAGTLAPDSDCSMKCAGDKAVQCGASWRLSVYTVSAGGSASTTTGSTISTTGAASTSTTTSTTISTTTTSSSSTTAPSATPSTISGLDYSGCYTDAASRTLGFFAGANSNTMAPNLCSSLCTAAGYTYAGIEYGAECYCGNSLAAGSVAPDAECGMKCAGDAAVKCGDSWRLSVYTVAAGGSSTGTTSVSSATPVGPESSTGTPTPISTSTASSMPSTSSTSSTSSSSISSSSSTSSTSTAGATPTGAAGLTYAGCYSDSTQRSLAFSAGATSDMTGAKCSTTCASLGYTVAGIEYGSECYCGNTLDNQPTKHADADCTSTCSGDSTQPCGGSWLLTVYSNGSPKIAAAPSVVPSVGDFKSIGCWSDSTGTRSLGDKIPPLASNNTIENCAAACAGFNYFGVEYGAECYCGNSLATTSQQAQISACSMTCAGNSSEFCGAGNFLNVYQSQTAAHRRRAGALRFWPF